MGLGQLCERNGCGRPAGAALSVDPRRLVVWIGDLETSAPGVNRLCTPCADDLRAPSGWERRDIREAPRLFAVAPSSAPTAAPPAPAPSAASGAPRRRARRAATPAEGQLPVTAAATLLEPSEETPLLARAFRGVRAVG